MANTVQVKRSGTASAAPTSLAFGELALNYADGKVFWKDSANAIKSFVFQNYLALTGGTLTGALVVTAGSASAPGVAISGDTNTGLAQIGGADTIGIATGGVERLRIGSDGSQTSVIPGGTTLLPDFQCRAWVNFDGSKDTTGAASTANTNRLIRGSGNVASVLRNFAGNYTVTFTTAMPDANYCVVISSRVTSTFSSSGNQIFAGYSASAFTIGHYESGSQVDNETIHIAVFR